MLNEKLYQSADFFLARTSILSADILKEKIHFSFTTLLDFSKTSLLFLEAIAIASPNLFKIIQKHSQNTAINHLSASDELKKMYFGMLKYFLRMASRPTPFGLFSFVWWGSFAENSHLNFEFEELQKSVRPDMEWIHSFINIFQKDYAFIKNFKVMLSPYVSEECGKFLLSTYDSAKNKQELTSIKCTEFTKKALKLAVNPIIYSELEEKLVLFFFQYDQEKAKACLWDIFQKGYFITELSFPMDQPSHFNKFIDSIKKKVNHISHTESMQALQLLECMLVIINEYMEEPIGTGFEKVESLLNMKSSFKSVEYPLQVDSYLKKEAKLPQAVKHMVEEAATVLFLLTHNHSKWEYINKYYQQFIEKYGMNRLIPIVDLISPALGLGIPKRDINHNKGKNTSIEKILSKYLSTGAEEIVVDSLIQEYKGSLQEEAEKASLSMELFFELIATSSSEVDKGNFTILMNPLVASAQAGSTFGRFLHLWDSLKRAQLADFLKSEENLMPDVIFVEACFQPLKVRTANVCFYQRSRNYQLQFSYHDSSDENLNVEDIYVGANEKQLYLYSKKLKKQIKVNVGTAVNSELAPPLLKLILDISDSQQDHFSPFIFEEFAHLTFIPRVRYCNVILSPSRWYFSYESLSILKDLKVEEISQILQEAFKDYRVPDFIFLTEHDNRLLIQRSNSNEFKLLLDHFLAKKEIILFEHLSLQRNSLVQSEKGSHVTEFVVPLVRKNQQTLSRQNTFSSSHIQTPLVHRLKIVGASDWLYAKLFVPIEFEKEFIAFYLKYFANYLISNQWVDKWFYVRYIEDKSHIRFRMHGSPDILNNQVLPALSQWMANLIENKKVNEFSLYNYDREVERYGGQDLIDFAEDIFCADSHHCGNFLEVSEKGAITLPLECVAALGILNILKYLHKDIYSMIQFSSKMEKDLDLLSGLRSDLKKTTALAEALIDEENKNELNLENPLLLTNPSKSINNLSFSLRNFYEKMEQIEGSSLWNHKDSIIDSIIHMHCNRLLGVDHILEKKARAIAYFTLTKYATRKIINA